MYIDYTELKMTEVNSDLDLSHLDLICHFTNGNSWYRMNQVGNVDIYHNAQKDRLKVRTSFPYFINGHNLFSNSSTTEKGISILSQKLGVDMYSASVSGFEFGAVVQTVVPVRTLINHHHSYNGNEFNRYRFGITYSNKNMEFKIYDAAQNARRKVFGYNREKLISDGIDINDNLLKVEVKYKNKEEFPFHKEVFGCDLVDRSFLGQCKEDLLEKYSQIRKTGFVKMPTEKKDVNVSTIPLLVLSEIGRQYGLDVHKMLNDVIVNCPNEVLNDYDKKYRKAKIKDNLRKLKSSNDSFYDLSEMLERIEIE